MQTSDGFWHKKAHKWVVRNKKSFGKNSVKSVYHHIGLCFFKFAGRLRDQKQS